MYWWKLKKHDLLMHNKSQQTQKGGQHNRENKIEQN